MIYVTADTHFSDVGIFRYEERPFLDVKEMNEALIAKWNQTVKADDTVYHLGDVGGSSREETESIFKRLNGRKILIMGNHDRMYTPKEWREMGFEEVYSLPVIFNGFYMFSHEPLYVNLVSPYANVFGHVHQNPAYTDFSARSFCACVERTGYAPVSFELIQKTILEEDRKEREKKN